MSVAAKKIDAHLEGLPEGSMRRRVLESARRFKSSWIELGRMLSQVKRDSLWQEWGYGSFDAYCGKELFLRKQTAEKLTMSYRFMEKHEPSVVAAEEPAPAPPFELIEVLSRAEAAGRLPEEGWRAMRDEILERSPTPAALNRQLNERFGPMPQPEPRPKEEGLRRLAALAHRLAACCAKEERVPAAVVERAKALAEDLDEIS
ncbi:MAG TPA: hypothetical protein VMK12_01455 [Anaeromyxobacteraceae bacterium]|nr:hypothetical protein [Anaeromyxobacteraceae bacterium]